MSNPRVYGTYLDADGLRHLISGVKGGILAKKKGDWDSYMNCGKYSSAEPDPNPDNVVSCLRCLVTRRTITLRASDGSTRGETINQMLIDEAMNLDMKKFLKNLDETMDLDVKKFLENLDATRGTGGTR